MNMSWYGQLPETWSLKRIGVLFSENTITNKELQSCTPLQFKYGELIKKDALEKDDDFLEGIRRYTLIQPNDILINGLNLNYDFISQRVAISKEEGCITPAYIAIRPNNLVISQFVCYLFKAMDERKIFHGLGNGIRLTLGFSDLKKIYIPFPPSKAQNQIVRYLDWKTSQIDKLIKAKQRQIELLQEQKQAVINNAVTKGGEGWQYRRLKTLVYDISIKGTPKNNFYIGLENIISWTSKYIDTGVTADGDSKTFLKGDILFGKLRPYLAKVYEPHCDGICSGEFLVLRGFDGHLTYLKYYLLSYDFIMIVSASTYGAKMPRANWDFIGNCNVPLPSYTEQQSIVAYLDRQCKNIDNSMDKLNDEIDLFAEYRTRLISDVVTGKIDIRSKSLPTHNKDEDTVVDNNAYEDEFYESEE